MIIKVYSGSTDPVWYLIPTRSVHEQILKVINMVVVALTSSRLTFERMSRFDRYGRWWVGEVRSKRLSERMTSCGLGFRMLTPIVINQEPKVLIRLATRYYRCT